MQKIKKLSNAVSSKIAAGEVCERPVNAVKELIENSVDAGATDIKIDIYDGGLSLIAITDNGSGISKDDLPLAIERFATSKAFTLDDVYSAATFGFRGEALAAISSVSDFTIKSGEDDDSIYELKSSFGEQYEISPAAGRKGTTISIKSLFENFPARRKFLKSARSLEAEVVKFIKQFALINDGISIKLNVNGKEIFSVDKDESTLKKLSNMFVDKEFNTYTYERGGISISASVTNPNCSDRFKRDAITIGVNGRLIQDRSLVQAVCQAYSRRIPDGRFPMVAINIRIDPKELDPNVHPAKLEVRFEKPRDIYSSIVEAVNGCFEKMNAFFATQPTDKYIADSSINDDYTQSYESGQNNSTTSAFLVKDNLRSYDSKSQNFGTHANDYTENDIENKAVTNLYEDDETSSGTTSDFEYEIVGQVGHTYIVLQTASDIIFIDQHVAHERILYEERLEREKQFRSSIVLHDPVTVKLDNETIEDIFTDIELLLSLGYIIGRLSDDEVIIKHIPPSIVRRDIEVEFIKTVSELFRRGVSKSYDRRLLSLSCKKAIKAGDRLCIEEMRYLIDELYKCSNNSTCPHGRPITFKMSLKELGSKFYR